MPSRTDSDYRYETSRFARRRPLFWLTLAVLVGIALDRFFEFEPTYVAVLALAAVIPLPFFRKKPAAPPRGRFANISLGSTFVLLAIFCGALWHAHGARLP